MAAAVTAAIQVLVVMGNTLQYMFITKHELPGILAPRYCRKFGMQARSRYRRYD